MASITRRWSALPVTTASSCISHSAVVPGSTSAGAVSQHLEQLQAGDETEQTLPPMCGSVSRAISPSVNDAKRQAPPRYNEGTLIDAMQNAWRFVENPAVRERLKEAKGIGTPATRAEIIKGPEEAEPARG
jgi:DNA topoisomerase IA